MNQPTVKVQMFGSFSIACGESAITEEDSRSRKIWLLLAYLIYCRSRNIQQSELTGLLWDEGEESINPQGALKTTLHRLRTLVRKLKDAAGCDLIVRHSSGYGWNPEVAVDFDVERFDQLCQEGGRAKSAGEKLDCYLQAIDLYTGDFLPKLSMESWVVPISAYFHNLYVDTVQNALSILESARRHEESVTLCRKALKIEPYSEELYRHLLQNLLATGQRDAAVSAYEDLSKLLMNHFGILPSEEIRALYREAVRTDNGYTVAADAVRDQLRENNPSSGALLCEYDAFKLLYQAMARAISRTGDVYHIALLTMKGPKGKSLSQRSLDLAMKNLQVQILGNMRRGDIATRCSASQFIIMLPKADYQGSCIVCARILRAFYHQHPHSPAEISYNVLPLEPTH